MHRTPNTNYGLCSRTSNAINKTKSHGSWQNRLTDLWLLTEQINRFVKFTSFSLKHSTRLQKTIILKLFYDTASSEEKRLFSPRGYLRNFWMGCAAGTLEPLTYTRASLAVFQKLLRSLAQSSQNKNFTIIPCLDKILNQLRNFVLFPSLSSPPPPSPSLPFHSSFFPSFQLSRQSRSEMLATQASMNLLLLHFLRFPVKLSALVFISIKHVCSWRFFWKPA